MSYYLRIYDNFHYMDSDEAYDSGEFQTLEGAIGEAKHIVKKEILHIWQSGTEVKELMSAWMDFGEDPSVCSTESNHKGVLFSARDYANVVINEMMEHLKNNGDNIQSIYQKTILFAAGKHTIINQMIPGTSIPYVVHLSNVCMEVIIASHHTDNFNLGLAIQLALLHDTVEDTYTTESELEEKFGIIIRVYVKALTKNTELPKEEQMIDSLNRIKKLPKEAWAVKLADRITNLQSPPSHWDNLKKKQYQEEAKIILEELNGGNQYLEDRLRIKIKEYETYIEKTDTH